MRIDMAIIWDNAPARGRIEVIGGTLINGSFMIGTGEYNQAEGRFCFTNTDLCHMFFAIDVKDSDTDAITTAIKITDTDNPFEYLLSDVFRQEESSLRIADCHVTVNAEINRLASL
jgi:hypothetical protein